MSDEGESMSEGFSASEDEWKPSKDMKSGESSDDDDSDFEESPLAGSASVCFGKRTGRKRGERKARNVTKQITKKRTIQSLRAKLYNKYRPPPKTSSPSSSVLGKNSPIPSTSRTNSKNTTPPNESKIISRKTNDSDSDSSSDSSIDNYFVNIKDLDIQSKIFNVQAKPASMPSVTPVPVFYCNVGLQNLSESASDDEKSESKRPDEAFDFNTLLEYAKSIERVKESVAAHNAEESKNKYSARKNIDTLDVYAVLTLGENQQNRSQNDGENKDDGLVNDHRVGQNVPSKLNKTKSTRVKLHTKTRLSSTATAVDTEDSDWEEVAGSTECIDSTANDISHNGNLEIHVEIPDRNREKTTKTKLDIEMSLKRRLNREIKNRQVLLHKASFLCRFGRIFFYNRLLNDTILMQNALKLLPSKSAYPSDKGTEIKYFQSMVTWFKSAVKLKTQNFYPEKSAAKTKSKAHYELLKQIEKKEACSKQDMIFILIILLRGMGLQCRLIANLVPLPLKPAQSDLLTIKKKTDDKNEDKTASVSPRNSKQNDLGLGGKNDTEYMVSSKIKTTEQKANDSKNQHDKGEKLSFKNNSSDNRYLESTSAKIIKESEEDGGNKIESDFKTSSVKNVKQTKINTRKANIKYEHISGKCSKSKEAKRVEKKNVKTGAKSITDSEKKSQIEKCVKEKINIPEQLGNSQKENKSKNGSKHLGSLKRKMPKDSAVSQVGRKKHNIETDSMALAKIIVHSGNNENSAEQPSSTRLTRHKSRSRSKSPQVHISAAFLVESTHYKDKFGSIANQNINVNKKAVSGRTSNKAKISCDFLKNTDKVKDQKRVLRSMQKTNEAQSDKLIDVTQLDGANDDLKKNIKNKQPNLKQLQAQRVTESSNEDLEPSLPKKPKRDRRVVSSDDENANRKKNAVDMWLEVWCDVEKQWMCIDIFKGKIQCVDAIRKAASNSLAYIFAFQNDLSIKDVTARYCPHWTTVIRKTRVDKTWLDAAISTFFGHCTKRDIIEDDELRRIHEEKPMPTAIGDYKNHPFYALERHLLKFEAIYPPDAPPLGYIRGESVYSRDCVHTLHSREIWLKQARTVKLGEIPYKIVKARPKWDRITQTVIKDQPLEIFGYWQTQDYEPPTAENGLVPRNAYGNVELFKASMLPRKTRHIRLPGLNRICKKLDIDCANAVVGFDFHQGACHPTYDGFVVCEEFEDQVIAAWRKDQEEQKRKEQEKYEGRVYGNWKKLIRGLLIRERLKLKYNF